MRTRIVCIVGVLALSIATSASAAVVAFDFYRLDNPPFPPLILPVSDGEVVTNLYAGLGVTFGCFNGTNGSLNLCVDAGNGGNAYGRAATGAASSPNVVHLYATGIPVFDERYGYLKATFSSTQGVVSIDARPIAPPEGTTITVNRPFLQAFNAQGQFLGTVNYEYGACNPNTTQCPWQTLTISRPANDIKFVAFSSYNSSGGIMYGQFDNLSFSVLDTDGDGLPDHLDNCRLVANPTQLDADGDQYGNICDGDLNNSGLVTTADFTMLRSVLNQPANTSPLAAAADLNGSGMVTTADFGILRAALNTPPGPSGYRPNCPPTCP